MKSILLLGILLSLTSISHAENERFGNCLRMMNDPKLKSYDLDIGMIDYESIVVLDCKASDKSSENKNDTACFAIRRPVNKNHPQRINYHFYHLVNGGFHHFNTSINSELDVNGLPRDKSVFETDGSKVTITNMTRSLRDRFLTIKKINFDSEKLDSIDLHVSGREAFTLFPKTFNSIKFNCTRMQ